jgi:hypothetical protein
MAGGARLTGFVTWLVAAGVPPAVAGGLEQRFVAHNVWSAIAIGLGWAILVAVARFFAVVARDVSSRWQARLADQADLFLQRKGPRFERRYREFVLSSLRHMDHKGLATVGPFTPEHDAVFVNVCLMSRPPQQIAPGILVGTADGLPGRRSLDDLIGRGKPAVLAVVGGPGSGKTTLLRHAALQACRRGRGRGGQRDIPVLLYLRDHAMVILDNPAVSVAGLLRAGLGDVGADEPPGWLEHKLREGRCLVLLDGLDEVARQGDRIKVSAWAEGQIRQYPGNDFVVSSRPKGYQSAPVEGAGVVEVCGLTDGQVEAFIRSWYLAAERYSLGTNGPEATIHATEEADDLLRRLEEAPALEDLAANPLLLTMTANVHRWRGALPGSRAKLYEEICEVMLWRRQEAKKLAGQAEIAGDKKKAVLARLAYTMMQRRLSDLTRIDVIHLIRPALARVSRGASPDEFLAEVSSNGLLAERETGQYAFAHQTFQEYLAAEHIRDGKLVSELAATVGDDWWSETTLLFAAMSNADPVVEACLAANSGPALALALECTEQDSDIDPGLRDKVNALAVAAASAGSDPERRRLFAGSLLSRHVRQRKRTAQGTQVCPRPVTAELYRLFLADTRVPEPDAPLPESGVAVGMRANDAVKFVQWASGLSDRQHAYRLPMAAELAELAARRHITALPSGLLPRPWTQAREPLPSGLHSREDFPLPWDFPGAPDPYEVSSQPLVSASSIDVAGAMLTASALVTVSALLLRARIAIRAVRRVGAREVLDGVAYLDVIGALDPRSGLAYVTDLVTALGGEVERARIPARSNDDSFRRARDIAVAIESELRGIRGVTSGPVAGVTGGRLPGLGRCVADAFRLAVTTNLILEHHLPAESDRDRVQQAVDRSCRKVLGSLFSAAITETLRYPGPGTRPARLAAALASAAQVGRVEHHTADPVTMETKLSLALRELAGALCEPGPGKAPEWFSVLNYHLMDSALPMFTRADRPDPGKAETGRIAALILAAEADRVHRQDIGDLFRQVAFGVTFLQGRMNGQQPAPEVIMLTLAPASSEPRTPAGRHANLSS